MLNVVYNWPGGFTIRHMAGIEELAQVMARRDRWRLIIRVSALLVFVLAPAWGRIPRVAPPFSIGYSAGFLIFWPMLVTVMAWLLMRAPGLAELRRQRARRIWAMSLIALSAWACLSSLWSNQGLSITLSAALPFALAAMFGVAVACAGPPPRTISITLLVGLGWNSVVSITQVANQGPVGLSWLGEFPITPYQTGVFSVVQAGDTRLLRPYGLLAHPNMLGGFLAIALMSGLALAVSRRPLLWLIGTILSAAGTWALLLTFSRGSWLGITAAAFALAPILWRLRLRERPALIRFMVTVATLLITAGIFGLTYWPFLAARAGVGSESLEQRSISDRAVYNDLAFRAIEQSPIIGAGIGNFQWMAAYWLSLTDMDLRGQPAHHVMLLAWAELGVVGLALTGLTLVAGIEAALQRLRQGNCSDGPERAAFLAGIIGLMIIGLIDHYPWTILHFQALWWGLMGAAAQPSLRSFWNQSFLNEHAGQRASSQQMSVG